MKKNFILFYLILILLNSNILSSKRNLSPNCQSIANCIICDSPSICKQCESSFNLIGTDEYSQNNIISCTNSDLSNRYYKSTSGVYYSCEDNNNYAYFRDDSSKCYRKDVLAINNYYTLNEKNYYPCNEGEIGISNCNECNKISSSELKCTKCMPGYAFKNNDNICHSIESELLTDPSLYKVDNQNYASCSNAIQYCSQCTSSSRCTQCQSGYFTVNNEKYKCLLSNEIDINSYKYYLEGNTYYSCNLNGGVSNCLKCSSKEICLECQNGYAIVDDDNSKCIKINSLNLKEYYTQNDGKNYFSCISMTAITNCEECDNTSSCNKCKNGYVFIDDDKEHCISEQTLDNLYIKIDNQNYKSCSIYMNDENCLRCENNHKCISCKDNYGILDKDYSQCKDISTELTGKTIFNEDGLYYSCSIIEGCKRCEGRNQCIETISDNYCILEESSVIKLNEINDLYYYLEDGNKCISCSSETLGIPNCHSCSLSSNSINCYQCKEGYSIVNNDRSHCLISLEYSINNEFFTIDNGINYYNCDKIEFSEKAIQNCQKCEYDNNSKKNKCIKCKTNYLILDDNDSICKNIDDFNSLINDKKILGDMDTTKYYTCNKLIPNCETCEINSENNIICISCKNNYIFLDNNKSKCLPKKDYINGHYYSNDNINFYSCNDNCYECDEETCKICNNNKKCITCDVGFEKNDFDICEKILKDNEDIKKNCVYITNLITQEIIYDESNINTLINNYVQNYYTNFKSSKHTLVKYYNKFNNFTILIFKNPQCSLYLYEDNNFLINTEEIIKELKKYIEKDIIQCVIIYKNNSLFSFYENSDETQKIDIKTVCPECLIKKYSIFYNYKNKITKDIGQKFSELIQKEKIDIFNENTEFFQTFCQNLQIEGIDIPLNKRKYILYQGNSSYNLGDSSKGDLYACNMNCSLINNYPENSTSECMCNLNYDSQTFFEDIDDIEENNKKLESENNKKEIDEKYQFSNNTKDSLEMFTCSKYAFTGENIKKNAGFYAVTISFVSQSVCLSFLIFKLKITSFAKLLILANPPPHKQKNNNSKNNEENNSNKKKVLKGLDNKDYYISNVEQSNYINNTNVPFSKKRFYSKKDKKEDENEENKFEGNGEIHHHRLNIINNNYVTPSKIKLNLEQKNSENYLSDDNDTNNDYDVNNGRKNKEMNYYPVIKFIEYDVNVYRNIGYSYEQKDIKGLTKKFEGVKVIQYNLLHKNEKTKLLPLMYKSLLIDHLPPKYGIYYDKRNFCDFYYYLFCLRHPLINLFLNMNHKSSNFIPFSVKLIKLIFIGILILFFNSILINQKYIYDKYVYFDEKFNFKNLSLNDKINSSEKLIYAIKHTFFNSLISYAIIMVIDIFLTWLFSIRRRIKNLLDEYYEIESGKKENINSSNKEEKNFEKELVEVSDLKCMYIFITGFFFAFMIAFFIYLVNFCYTYKGVVDDLFLAGLWTFIVYIIMPVISSFIISILRYLGLKCKIIFIYNFSRILMEI